MCCVGDTEVNTGVSLSGGSLHSDVGNTLYVERNNVISGSDLSCQRKKAWLGNLDYLRQWSRSYSDGVRENFF